MWLRVQPASGTPRLTHNLTGSPWVGFISFSSSLEMGHSRAGLHRPGGGGRGGGRPGGASGCAVGSQLLPDSSPALAGEESAQDQHGIKDEGVTFPCRSQLQAWGGAVWGGCEVCVTWPWAAPTPPLCPHCPSPGVVPAQHLCSHPHPLCPSSRATSAEWPGDFPWGKKQTHGFLSPACPCPCRSCSPGPIYKSCIQLPANPRSLFPVSLSPGAG